MTTADNANFQPWSVRGCTYEVAYRKACGEPGVFVDGINGRRCAEHPSVFDPALAVQMAVTGWTDTAAAYCRAEIEGAA